MAPVAVLLLLLGGTALTSQVETDLQTQLDTPFGETPLDLPGTAPPLKLNNLRLPQDLPFQIPEGFKIDPSDLSKLTIPEDMELDLPEGFDLSDLDFNLPEDFDLELPEGAEFDPSTGTLKLPDGGKIKLPDGRDFDLPKGSTLDLPPEIVEELLKQGLPAGRLPHADTFHFKDMPPGLNVGIDPAALENGGKLRLPGGTEIQLPEGFTLPPEALAGLPFLLPAGTLLDLPSGNGGGGEVGEGYDEFPLPDENAPPDSAPPKPPPEPRVRVATEIDTLPSRIEKGKAFQVAGYVREEQSGRDVAGAPVVIYMNETKAQPGILVGRGSTDARGRFDITVTLPTDKPARQYQLVNHAGAFTSGAGTKYAGGWGDPPIETFSTSAWVLDIPARDGLGAETRLGGTLVDATGAPVPFARADLIVDGLLVRTGATGADGTFSALHVFPAKGTYRVQLSFPGNAYYDGTQSAERTIIIDEAALEITPTRRAERGSSITLTGRVLLSGAPAPGKLIDITVPFAASVRATTDARGNFTASLTVPSDAQLGPREATYRFDEFSVTKTQVIEVWTRGRLALDAPARARVDLGASVALTLTDLQAHPIPGQALIVTLSGPGGLETQRLTTGADGVATRTLRPPQAADGAYILSARLASNDIVQAAAVSRPIALGVVDIEWLLPSTIVRGRDAVVSAALTFYGEPMPGEPVALALVTEEGRTTDAEGRASWTVRIPAQAPLGETPAKLLVPAHDISETRTTRVVAVPVVTLNAPERFDPDEGIAANATLVDDLAKPIGGHTLTFRMRAGNWTREERVTLDAAGAWSGTLNTTDAPREVMQLTAHHEAQNDHLEAQDVQALTALVAPVEGASILPWLAALGVLAAVGIAGIVIRTQRARSRLVPVIAPQTTATVLRAPGFDLDLGIPVGQPLVWGVDEPLLVTIRPQGSPAAGASVVLRGEGIEARIPLESGKLARADLCFAKEGAVALTAERTDDALAAPVRVTFRVVDYRKEVAREFDVLLDRARTLDPGISRRTTVQEVEWMLSHKLGAEAATPLSEMALVMDVTNYSHHPVARREYLRFLDALRALDPLLPAASAVAHPAAPVTLTAHLGGA